jgi:hypothetical protein
VDTLPELQAQFEIINRIGKRIERRCPVAPGLVCESRDVHRATPQIASERVPVRPRKAGHGGFDLRHEPLGGLHDFG